MGEVVQVAERQPGEIGAEALAEERELLQQVASGVGRELDEGPERPQDAGRVGGGRQHGDEPGAEDLLGLRRHRPLVLGYERPAGAVGFPQARFIFGELILSLHPSFGDRDECSEIRHRPAVPGAPRTCQCSGQRRRAPSRNRRSRPANHTPRRAMLHARSRRSSLWPPMPNVVWSGSSDLRHALSPKGP